mmetsp:Transcript_22870/g.38299  ORF Transcript_22870/g.38299 Transcript_22870/m.38299 type:complete len:146 (-) Transcript_22870:859-1296(-)
MAQSELMLLLRPSVLLDIKSMMPVAGCSISPVPPLTIPSPNPEKPRSFPSSSGILNIPKTPDAVLKPKSRAPCLSPCAYVTGTASCSFRILCAYIALTEVNRVMMFPNVPLIREVPKATLCMRPFASEVVPLLSPPSTAAGAKSV